MPTFIDVSLRVGEDAGEAVEPEVDDVVRGREREPRAAGPGRAEALAGRDGDALIAQERVGRHTVRKAQPEVEAALRRLDAEPGGDAVPPGLVEPAALGDGVLRA